MRTIKVSYLQSPTSPRLRIKASYGKVSITCPFDYSVSLRGGREWSVVKELCDKLGWSGQMVRGDLDDRTVVFVFVDQFSLYGEGAPNFGEDAA